jgi:DNA-binding MarR family transcriptional regulator
MSARSHAKTLAGEIKKRRAFDLPQEEAYLNLLRTVSVLAEPFDRLLKAHGISEAKYNVLRILRGAGGEGLPSLEIGVRMIQRVPDVTRIVDRLEADGFVRRARTNKDRRVVRVQITTKGSDLLKQLDRAVNDLHQSQFSTLSRREIDELNRLLVKAREDARETSNDDEDD